MAHAIFGILLTFACIGGMILFQKFVMLPGAYDPMYDQFVAAFEHRNEIGIENLILWTVVLIAGTLAAGVLLSLIDRSRQRVQEKWLIDDQKRARAEVERRKREAEAEQEKKYRRERVNILFDTVRESEAHRNKKRHYSQFKLRCMCGEYVVANSDEELERLAKEHFNYCRYALRRVDHWREAYDL